jgi:hypothetical protein
MDRKELRKELKRLGYRGQQLEEVLKFLRDAKIDIHTLKGLQPARTGLAKPKL